MLAFSAKFRKIPMKLFSSFFPFDEVVLQSKNGMKCWYGLQIMKNRYKNLVRIIAEI